MKTLVIGLGNPIVSDDSVGLRVAVEIRKMLDGDMGAGDGGDDKGIPCDVEVAEDYWGGLRLMERLIGFDRAIVVDAICTDSPPGTIQLLKPDDIPTQKSNSAHDLTLPMALKLGRESGAHLPRNEDILLIGIEAEDVLTFSEQCTPAVEAAIPRAVEEVLAALRREG
ncbi:MAG: hydrogenase maturation protease [Planctomycetota bacterium]|nr:hydrogenase maturation protease [Planctomycetota bacterium]